MKALDIVLLHGGWHCSASWGPLVPLLLTEGHRVVTPDLPGHGWRARFPMDYFTDGQSGLHEQPATLGATTLEMAADETIGTLTSLRASGEGRSSVLVSHSSSGAVASRVAEKRPDLVDQLVYVAGIVPSRLRSSFEVGALPEYGSPTMDGLVVGDPASVGALRINPRSTDPQYRDLLRSKFYSDLAPEEAAPFLALICPDQPLSLLAEPVSVTPQRWGSIPRTYVATLRDNAIAPAVQEILMNDADTLTSTNRFQRIPIDTGHSPFASRPAELAGILNSLGR